MNIDKKAALAEAARWIGSSAFDAFLAGFFFSAFGPDKYDPENFAPVEEYFRNPDKQ